ncbi:MAG: Si-specific NAD(P)(+) transhydrogenase [Phycisphaeraceae bacterium]|nr:Si-specific NAD(P)(+) transhydrogenase [Phycisphaerales bacterium]QOJ16996.1 MAG: Si-specific NAD(P)(+) transhydrogenase [Phycisphaeraceae bacterium]
MSTFDFDLVCIGSGPAGQRAAVQAAKLRKRVAIVEKARITGGVCVDTGTIPSKTFREAVISFTGYGHRFHRSRAKSHGVRATLEELLGGVTEVVHREAEVVEDQLRRNDITVIRGVASFDGPHALRVATGSVERVISAEKIVIAVGTNPAPVPTPGLPEDVVMTSDGVIRMKHLPRTMTVVGGGVIGIEYASIFAAVGVDVTLIDRRPRPLEFLDHEIVDELIHQMRKMNVTFRLNEAVASISVTETPPVRGVVTLESGKRIVSDVVLYAIGRVGATGLLNVAKAGLTSDDRGRLKVNEHFQTDVPHIYAAGDVIGYPSLAATSSEQGRLAACHAFGHNASAMSEHFPIGIYAVPEISMVGATEQELTEQKVPYEVGVARYREIARGQIVGDDSGMFKMLFHRETRQLLGVHAIGTAATELIHIGQAVLRLGGGLDYFVKTVFNYPTFAECYKVAALNALNKLAL